MVKKTVLFPLDETVQHYCSFALFSEGL